MLFSDATPIRNLISRMQNDLLAFRQPFDNLRLKRAAMSDLYITHSRPTALDDKNTPGCCSAEECARRNDHHIFALPDNDANIDTIAVAESSGIIHEIHHHINPLFLNSQSGDLSEP